VCVIQSDGFYAQCISCEPTSFENSCGFWTDDITAAAEAKCQLTCGDDVPCTDKGLDCCVDEDCDGETVCAIQSDGNFAQCIDCSEPNFDNSCGFWTSDILTAAESKCGETCPPSATKKDDLDCNADADCDGDDVCVIQSDGFYAQCISCEPTSFENSCGFWTDDITAAAEAKCQLTCGDDVPCTDKGLDCCVDEDCDGETVCAIQSDGNFAQCIDCSEPNFDNSCGFWTSDILTAAESKCGETCPPSAVVS